MSFCALASKEKFKDHFEAGVYTCAECGQGLFQAKAKYAHHTPWPAFGTTISDDAVTKELETEKQESSDKPSFKVFCSRCKTQLGHEFIGDGPDGTSRF